MALAADIAADAAFIAALAADPVVAADVAAAAAAVAQDAIDESAGALSAVVDRLYMTNANGDQVFAGRITAPELAALLDA